MAENNSSFIVDASFVLSFLLPDEKNNTTVDLYFDRYHTGDIEFAAPSILPYEVANTLVSAVKRERITEEQSKALLNAYERLKIHIIDLPMDHVLEIALKYELSFYDAAYITLSKLSHVPLFIFNKKLKSLQ